MDNYEISENRISLINEGHLDAYIDFSFTYEMDERVSFDKVFVDPELRGKSVAANLVKFGVDHFKELNIKVIATCPFADFWLMRNKKEYSEYIISPKNGAVCSL
ncbi:MAG: N-acetyltransferase [Spirochaetaceae bacterium]|nr:N-acetyltransferase [Spirochaetaceae bacterium]